MEATATDQGRPQSQCQLTIEIPSSPSTSTESEMPKSFGFLTRFHAGYFRISFSLCGQALLWKALNQPTQDNHALRLIFRLLPQSAFILLWSVALACLASLSLLYLLKCFLYFRLVKDEFCHHVGVNYLFAPWISWLLLLQSSPFLGPKHSYYLVLWWVFSIPILLLDIKIYGQWFTKGKRFLSAVANPTSLLSVIGNLVGARAAAEMGWKESAVCLFSLGFAHYLVLFVTLYQRFSGSDRLPTMLRPVFFLFFAAPSMASLAWVSISGNFDQPSKMLFFLSLFLFASLVSRPNLFKKAMKKFHVAWWAYSFPLSVLALASVQYAQEVKGGIAHGLMLILSVLSVLVSFVLLVFTIINTNHLLQSDDPDDSMEACNAPKRYGGKKGNVMDKTNGAAGVSKDRSGRKPLADAAGLNPEKNVGKVSSNEKNSSESWGLEESVGGNQQKNQEQSEQKSLG
ncbi:S-type anion channel SLAH4-like [Aristolochia californica]|uniref:S-type anion channel SLAH4-like n=1 Tax=Aristolochia californica TaxID=171875 RepID=UPI0035D75EEC